MRPATIPREEGSYSRAIPDPPGRREKLAAPKRTFTMGGTLVKTSTGMATRIAAKIRAHTYDTPYVSRLLDRTPGRARALC